MILTAISMTVKAQNDSFLIKRINPDSSKVSMNMDAVYNRPFLTAGNMPIAMGGYLEANTQYASTDGITEGFSFQMQRLTIFLSSTIGKKIKFLSELEFEDGTREINLEFAAMDIEFHPLVNLRGGIMMNPIGAFNQNHDGPRWEFIDRPVSATTIIPSTLSNAGFGLYGKHFQGQWTIGYEAYLTNGFNDKIISNDENRTSLAAGKKDANRFEKSNSGLPMFTGKLALRNRKIGELGLSYMTGVYNLWQSVGIILDNKRSLHVMALDFNTSMMKNNLNILGELVKVLVEVPKTYSQQFGSEQMGGHLDIVGTILKKPMLGWEKAKLNLVIRIDYADYNQGKFRETGGNIGDHVWAIVPGISFRPLATTVLRFNFRFEQQTDLLGNPPAKTGVLQFGFSSYF